jgi:hypothetical protein
MAFAKKRNKIVIVDWHESGTMQSLTDLDAEAFY